MASKHLLRLYSRKRGEETWLRRNVIMSSSKRFEVAQYYDRREPELEHEWRGELIDIGDGPALFQKHAKR